MALTNKIYNSWELVEQDISTAPSLDLPDIVVEKYFRPYDKSEYLVFYANVKSSVVPGDCPNCKTSEHWKRAGNGKPRLVHDVERNNFRVDIIILPKRFECKNCGLKITPPLRGIEENTQSTTRLMEFLRKECFLQPHTTLAQRSGFSVDTIQNILSTEAAKYDAERAANPLTAPRVLGIDEKHIVHKMRGTLVDVETGRLLNMLEDNSATTMQNAIMLLKGWDTGIEVVTTDMNNAYVRWLNDLLPKATIVVDKFHVIQGVQQRISETKKQLYKFRKDIIKSLDDPKEIVRQRALLHEIEQNSRLFNYSQETLLSEGNANRAIIMANVVEEFPEFRLLRELYAGIEKVYQQETYDQAKEAWDAWMNLLPPAGEKQYQKWCDLYSVVPPLFDKFRSFHRQGFLFFEPYILNYFKPGCRETNAATEGINTLIERINREGNGLKFEHLRAKSLYASLIHERKRYGIDLRSVKTWIPTMGMAFGSGFGGSSGKYVWTKQHILTTKTEAVNIPHTNAFEANEELFKALSDTDASAPLFEVDDASLLDYACDIFKTEE